MKQEQLRLRRNTSVVLLSKKATKLKWKNNFNPSSDHWTDFCLTDQGKNVPRLIFRLVSVVLCSM